VDDEDRKRQQVMLELDPGSEPIAGRLLPADGAGSEFVGYLALISAIEAIRSTGASPPATPAPEARE
jgi:hypothetical protein